MLAIILNWIHCIALDAEYSVKMSRISQRRLYTLNSAASSEMINDLIKRVLQVVTLGKCPITLMRFQFLQRLVRFRVRLDGRHKTTDTHLGHVDFTGFHCGVLNSHKIDTKLRICTSASSRRIITFLETR